MMALDRYRLKHLKEQGHRGARRASRLLQRPDRLIGLILIGNNLVNVLAAAIVTIIAIRLLGNAGIAVGSLLLTLALLVFAEITPKTVAALHPERVAFPASVILAPLLKLLYPVVWLVNVITNGLLMMLGYDPRRASEAGLTTEELRTVVNESGHMIPDSHQGMLLNILELEKVTVDDIMVPRGEIGGIDLDAPLDDILEQLEQTPYTRVLTFRGSIDNVAGFLHSRRAMQAMLEGRLTQDALEALIREPYFIPEGTPLNRQLLNFQRNRRRTALVVDEYGDVQGLVTMADLLEEIVGEFATDPADAIADVLPQQDGSFLVDGSANLRELVRTMHWELPTDGPKTLNGLIVEHLESLPEPGTSLMVAGYPIDVVQIQDNAVKTARVRPQERRATRAHG